jgi:CheY-like chemotaxis protein
MAALMTVVHRVAFLGLRESERQGIVACLRLASARGPRYELTALIDEAGLLIADAEHPPSVQLAVASEMLNRTLFIGSAAPVGAAACMPRPIDPEHLLRELDALVGGPVMQTERPTPVRAEPPLQAQASPPEMPDSGVDLLLDLPDPAARRSTSSLMKRRGAPSAAPAAGVVEPEAPAPTALLVDDSEIALRFLESRLQRWGLLMDRALSSGRAIEMMAKQRYDFVFLDVELGAQSDLDGMALCQHIKRDQGHLVAPSVVIMVSAHASQIDRVRGDLAGCDGFLSKPLDEIELQRLLMRQGLKPRIQVVRGAAVPAQLGAVHPPQA